MNIKIKFSYIILMFLSFLFLIASASYSADFNIIQLTETEFHNIGIGYFAVSETGYIVWQEVDEASRPWAEGHKILLCDGTSIVQITDNFYVGRDFQVNSIGHVAWVDKRGHIYLFDGVSIFQLDPISGYDPRINDDDNVVWSGYDVIITNRLRIYLYDGSGTTQLTETDYSELDPQINNNGQIVWRGDGELHLYDGSTILQLTNDIYSDHSQEINDDGYIAWAKHDGAFQQIWLYNGTTTSQFTDNLFDDYYPHINNNGCIVWTEGLEGKVFFFDGSKFSQLTYNNTDDRWPQINNNNHIVWGGYDGSDWEIYFYDGNNIYQVTDNDFDDFYPQLSDDGLLVWIGGSMNDNDLSQYGGYAQESTGEIYYTHVQIEDGSNQDYTGPPPTLIEPANKSEVTTLTPSLVVDISPDAIEDGLTFTFQIDTTRYFFDSPNLVVSPDIVADANGNVKWEPSHLNDNSLYYWRVRASNGIEQSQWAWSFFVNLENDAPGAPWTPELKQQDLSYPYPILDAHSAFDIDGDKLTYTFELYQDISLTTLLCSGDSESTSWTAPIRLEIGTYYYRVRATDEHGLQGPWSSITEFTLFEPDYTDLDDLDLGWFGPNIGGGCFITNLF